MKPREVYGAYSRAWNVQDRGERRELLERALSEDAVYVDDEVPEGLIGRDALLGYIADSHTEMPRPVVSDSTAPKILGGRVTNFYDD